MISPPNLIGSGRTPMIQQSEASECGLACLAMIAGYHGYRTDLVALRQRFSFSLKGATLGQLMDCAEKIGLSARPLRGDLDDLDHLALPAVLHWDLNHFLVLTKITRHVKGPKYHLQNPATGHEVVTRENISQHWTGVALELAKSDTFLPRIERKPMAIRQLWSSITGLWSSLRKILILSIILQLAALAAPFYLQSAIDTAYQAADKPLLYVLALGFGTLALIEFATNWLRSLVILHIGNALSYQVVVNLFRHLLSLPLSWFEKRHVGDIISRFGSTAPITQLITNGMVASLIDGAMAILTLALMLLYSPLLGALALLALLLFLGLRVVSFQSVRLQNVNSIAASALEQTAFIESIRGIATIKAFGQESNRLRLWQLKKVDAVNASIRLGRLGACFESVAGLITSIERVVFVYIAVSFALDGRMTVGVIFALQAYKQQFLNSGIRLIEQVINLSIIRVHLERISDIAFSRGEDGPSVRSIDDVNVQGRLSLEGIGFVYGAGEPPVLRSITFQIQPGEMVAFVGPSGGGKTTLMKIMMGLLDPNVGRVLVDGVPLPSLSKNAYRRHVGSVAQSDTLFNGTIAENIGFFASDLDMARVIEVARLAHVDEDIQRMPLGYDSLVGDMGSVLSGGQCQRVLLARALYNRPKILFMDEGTANLDQDSEEAVLAALKQLAITRVVIAHRPHAIAAADRVFMVHNTTVREVERKITN